VRAPSLSRNAAYNLAGALVPMVVALVTIPIYLRLLGEARYGVLAILWLLLGYFGLFDLGLSRAVAQALAHDRDAPPERRTRIFWASLILNAAFGALSGLALYVAIPPLVSHLFHVPPDLQAEISAVLPWIAVGVPVTTMTGVFVGALESRERFLQVNVLQTFGAVSLQIVPVVAAIAWGPFLQVVVPAVVLARALTGALTAIAAFRAVPVGRLALPDAGLARGLMRYGLWISVTNVIGPLLASLDQFFVGAVLGPAMVAYYSIPFNLCVRLSAVPFSIERALFPRFAGYAPNDAARLAETAFRTLVPIMTLVCAPAILLARPFLDLWLGAKFSEMAAPVAEILLIGTFLNGIAVVPFSILRAQGRPEAVAKIHAIELIPFVAVLWLCLRAFGLPGAAFAWTVRTGADLMLLFRASRLPRQCAGGMLVATAFVAAAFGLAEILRPDGLPALALAGVAGLAALYWGVRTEPTLAELLRNGHRSLRKSAGATFS
jgi:O-antigen/teichoic acid export membrane protein